MAKNSSTPKTKAAQDLEEKNPLLAKVRDILTQTDLSKWQIGGEDLKDDLRFAHPREVYDQALIIDIPGASLVLHASQPVKATYLKGGYSYIPIGPANFTVQVRDKIFNAERLVDPKYAGHWKGKRCDIVATGEVAKALYHEMREKVRTFRLKQDKEFDDHARSLLQDLPGKVDELSSEAWIRNEEGQSIRFTTEIDGIKVTIERALTEFGYEYNIYLSQDKHKAEQKGARMARSIYLKLDELSQNSELLKLNEVLKKAGF